MQRIDNVDQIKALSSLLLLISNESISKEARKLIFESTSLPDPVRQLQAKTYLAYLEYQNAIMQVEDKILSKSTKKKLLDIKDLDKPSDYSAFLFLEAKIKLITNLNELHYSAQKLPPPPQDPSISNAGLSAAKEGYKAARHLLLKIPTDINQCNDLAKAIEHAKNVVVHQNTPLAKTHIDNLYQSANLLSGKPRYAKLKKCAGAFLMLVGVAIIGLGIAGIPFTLGASAAIGAYVGGSLTAAGGALLFYKGHRRGVSKKFFNLAKKAENQSTFLNTAEAQPDLNNTASAQPTTEVTEAWLHEAITKLIASDPIDNNLAEQIFIRTKKDPAPRNFICDTIIPSLSDDQLFKLTKAIMDAHTNYRAGTESYPIRTSVLSSDLYFAFAQRMKYAESTIEPESMAILNRCAFDCMQKIELFQKSQVQGGSLDATVNGISFKMKRQYDETFKSRIRINLEASLKAKPSVIIPLHDAKVDVEEAKNKPHENTSPVILAPKSSAKNNHFIITSEPPTKSLEVDKVSIHLPKIRGG